jgi:hypothetical protein
LNDSYNEFGNEPSSASTKYCCVRYERASEKTK